MKRLWMMCLQEQETGDGKDGGSDGLSSSCLVCWLFVCRGVAGRLLTRSGSIEVEQVNMELRCSDDCSK